MNFITYTLLLFLLISSSLYGYFPKQIQGVVSKPQAKVMICNSGTATKYHAHVCKGLAKCSKEILSLPTSEAIKKGYKPCGYCY